MRLAAYLMAADPAWLEASVLSYYDIVDRIVVSYDESGRSWSGSPIAVQECLTRLRAIDTEHKMQFEPGSYCRPVLHLLENDTFQRQCALDAVGTDFDWVLQLDTDEVLLDSDTFVAVLAEADRRGFKGVEYPARNLYQYAGGSRFLERSGRGWQHAANYPGPVAIKPATTLALCRQAPVPLFRADFAHHNTDPAHARDAPVHRVVSPSQAIVHYSWVRSVEHLRRKAASSGHAKDLDWTQAIDTWLWRRRHPWLAAAGTPLRRTEGWNSPQWLRVSAITMPEQPDLGTLVAKADAR